MNLNINSNPRTSSFQERVQNFTNRISDSSTFFKKRISLTDELSSVECETADINLDALKSVASADCSDELVNLSSMFRQKIALKSRVTIPSGQVLPSFFFNS
jgi:hypothetical protein